MLILNKPIITFPKIIQGFSESLTSAAGAHETMLVDKFKKTLKTAEIDSKEVITLLEISAEQKKKDGIFFTPKNLSHQAGKTLEYSQRDGSVLDPACGTGNLLIEVAEKLPVYEDLGETLLGWNEFIYGLDINKKFIELTKKKLINLALERGAIPKEGFSTKQYMQMLRNIRVGDFLLQYQRYKGKVDNILMNPPFSNVTTPRDIKWTSGRSNAAALFTYLAAKIISKNGKIVAILPDVLRSGARYEEWRMLMQQMCCHQSMPLGNFQKGVQVDVFILHGTKREVDAKIIVPEDACENKTLEKYFKVSVGPVVPHRDKFEGKESPYAHAKILPHWQTISVLDEKICHSGRKIQPPFIAIRRTSSPKDKSRIVASIINCEEVVSVENHIIILEPKDKKISTCQEYLNHLRSPLVNDYVNQNIRCRHLTVGVVKNIPALEKN